MSKHGTRTDGRGAADGMGWERAVVGSREEPAMPVVTEMASGLMTVVSMVSGKLIPVEREKGDR